MQDSAESIPRVIFHPGDKSAWLSSSFKVLVERIVSCGQVTPPDQWYDQDQDEWVILLRGRATLILAETTATRIDLEAGDYLFIPAHQRHRVEFTSQKPPCVWLAIHGQLTKD